MTSERERNISLINHRSELQQIVKDRDMETFTLYLSDIRASSKIKAQILQYFFPEGLKVGDWLIDLGASSGDLVMEFNSKYPQLKYLGVDLSSKMLHIAKKENPKFNFVQADVLSLPLRRDIAAVITMSGILHEIFSYSDENFSIKGVIHLLKSVEQILSSGGRLIIKDPAKPENPDEILAFRLKKDDGVTIQGAKLSHAQPRVLSTYSKYIKFQQEFLKTDSIQKLFRYDSENDLFFAPAWYLSEFLRHRNLSKTISYWRSEMREQYGVFTVGEMQQAFNTVGLSTIFVLSYFNPFSYAAIINKEITIWDSKGFEVSQDERLPTNLIAVAEKR